MVAAKHHHHYSAGKNISQQIKKLSGINNRCQNFIRCIETVLFNIELTFQYLNVVLHEGGTGRIEVYKGLTAHLLKLI